MEYYFEVFKIIDGGLKGDTNQVSVYANKLALKLKEHGDEQTSGALHRRLVANDVNTVSVKKTFKSATMSFERPLPVERDSRFSLADRVVLKDGDVNLFLSDQQSTIVEKFVGNVRAREKLLDMGVPVNASLLLHGEPGTGKSTMAAFIASKLGLPLVTARSDALISSYLGSTSKNIRSLLEYASSEPCVLFLDEFDAIAKARDDKNEIGELKRVVVSLLQNIDSLGDAVLIAATNHPHLLDPAIWRRFHYKMELEKPSDKTREAMFLSLLKSVNLNKNDILQLVKFSQGLTGAEVEMAAHSYLRTIIIESHTFNVTGLIRELLSQRYHGIDFESEKRNESLIKLRNEDESLFSYRVLGALFSMAESNARKIVKGNSND